MSLWSAQQHEWLEAMGLQVLQVTTAAPVVASTPAATSSTSTPRLQAALLRALATCADAERRLAAFDLDFDALRGDAAGKRALWPRLRALRASAQ